MATMRLKVYALAAGLAAGFAAYAVWNSALLQEAQPAVAQVAQEAKPEVAKVAQETKPEAAQVSQEAKPEVTQIAQQEAKPAVAQEPKPAQIDRNGVIILIRSSLIALDQANKTGNYTVLRDLGAPNFQATNTAARLGDIFAGLRRDKVDLSGVAALDPQLTLLPQIEPNGLMHMTGFFPSVPAQVKFELAYAPVDGQWKLFGISVGLGQSGPAAPPAPQAAAPQAAAPAAPAAAAAAKKPKLKDKEQQ
jgi:hypothetical protein